MTRKWMSHSRHLIGHTDTALASYWLVQTQSTGWLRSKLEAMRLRSLEQGPIVHFSFLSPIKIWLNSAKLQDTFLDRPRLPGHLRHQSLPRLPGHGLMNIIYSSQVTPDIMWSVRRILWSLEHTQESRGRNKSWYHLTVYTSYSVSPMCWHWAADHWSSGIMGD